MCKFKREIKIVKINCIQKMTDEKKIQIMDCIVEEHYIIYIGKYSSLIF